MYFTINLLSKLYFRGTIFSELHLQETLWFYKTSNSTNETTAMAGKEEDISLLVYKLNIFKAKAFNGNSLLKGQKQYFFDEEKTCGIGNSSFLFNLKDNN